MFYLNNNIGRRRGKIRNGGAFRGKFGVDFCAPVEYADTKNYRVFPKKGEAMMRIAVTYEDGQVFQHFGHTSRMKLYDVEDGRIVKEQIADTEGSGHGGA